MGDTSSFNLGSDEICFLLGFANLASFPPASLLLVAGTKRTKLASVSLGSS